MTLSPQTLIKNITHLFWGKFSYKLVVKMHTRLNAYKRRVYGVPVSAINRRNREEAAVLRYCPDTKNKDWKYASHEDYVAIFFKNKEDADHAIISLGEQVIEIWKPHTDAHVAIMNSDSKAVVRDSLFFNQFTWCITFQIVGEKARGDIKEWACAFYELTDTISNERVHISDGHQIRMYLDDESDVVMTKLALADVVRKIERVVLTK